MIPSAEKCKISFHDGYWRKEDEDYEINAITFISYIGLFQIHKDRVVSEIAPGRECVVIVRLHCVYKGRNHTLYVAYGIDSGDFFRVRLRHTSKKDPFALDTHSTELFPAYWKDIIVKVAQESVVKSLNKG